MVILSKPNGEMNSTMVSINANSIECAGLKK